MKRLIFIFCLLTSFHVFAQDGRGTVGIPLIPQGCKQIFATKCVVSTPTVNLDPFNFTSGSGHGGGGTGTQGTLGATGGTDYEPSASCGSYSPSESSDYTAVYTNGLNSSLGAFNNCVELSPSGSNYGFVMPPFKIPSGVKLVLDPGIDVFASRNPGDFDDGSGNCGTTFSGSGIGSGCNAWITSPSTTGSGIYGFGRLDERAWDKFTTGGNGKSYAYNDIWAYCEIHGGASNGSPGCPGSSPNGGYAAPNCMALTGANSFTIYGITLANCGGFGVQWNGPANGFTLWDFKYLNPMPTANTDAFDPTEPTGGGLVQNFTVNYSVFNLGDDATAPKSYVSGVKNGSILNTVIHASDGLSIGSATGGAGVTNLLFDTVFCSGLAYKSDNACIKIKSPSDSGVGTLVNNITYKHFYITNENYGIRIYPYYSCSGSNPLFTNITLSNITLGSSPGSVTIQGIDSSHKTTISINNFTGTPGTPITGCSNAGDQNTVATVGPDPVNITLKNQISTAAGSSVSGTTCTSGCVAPYTAVDQKLFGDLVMTTPSGNNQTFYHDPGSSTNITLQAVLNIGADYGIHSYPALASSTITFFDGATSVGTGSLTAVGSNGTLATLNLPAVGSGTHNYTAVYSAGDSFYTPTTAYTFGSVQVVVGTGSSFTVTPSTPNATVVSDLASCSSGSCTINFAPGTYTQATSTWTFPCVGGNIFQGPVVGFTPGTGVVPTAIFAPTFSNSHAVTITGNAGFATPGAGCTIQYLGDTLQNFYVSPPVSGLELNYNSFSGLLGSVSGGADITTWSGLYVDQGSTVDLGNSDISWNTWGSSCSDVDSSSTDFGGHCGGIDIFESYSGLTINNNNTSGQIEQFVLLEGKGTNGANASNLSILNNDMVGVHRAGIEIRNQNSSNFLVQFNDFREPNNPVSTLTAGIKANCCNSTTVNSPTVNGNVIVEDGGSALYGIWGWGFNSTYSNNLVQGTSVTNPMGIGGAGGFTTVSPSVLNNVIQGGVTVPTCAQGGTYPGSCTDVSGTITSTGNTGSGTISPLTSTAPMVTPASGVFPGSSIVATISNLGANTQAWCTNDGSTPIAGSAPYSTGVVGTTFNVIVPVPGTLKCVGMWADGANPFSYATNYGFVPSAVVTNSYTSPITGSINLMINGVQHSGTVVLQ